jgi:tetratricopeptide (TPR) repeat protein
VGQLNARGAILAAAEIYFEGRRPGEMKEADLLLKAKLLMQKGQDASERGNVEEGLRLFEAAFAATEELVSRRPSDPERLFAHGQSAFWVGDLYRQSFDLERSSYYLETYKTATQSALDLQPDYPDATLELAYANVNLGQLAVELSRDPRAASGLFADALKIVEAEASDKEALQNLNLILGYQAQAMAQFDLASNVLQVMDKWDIVVGELDKARKSDRSLNYDVARDLNVMGELERRAGATERGEAHVARAREIARQELTTDPSNDTWLSLASRLELKVAAQGCPKAGEENAFEFSDAVEVRRALSCLERSDVRKATICRDFVDWLATQKPNFIAEITWAGILSRCSRDGAVSADSLLLEAHDRAAETIFFAKSPHTYSIWAQTELAKFNSAGRNTVRVQKLRDDLKRRGWNASQKIQE